MRLRPSVLVLLLATWACCVLGVGCRPKPRVVRVGYFPNLSHAQAVLGTSSGELAAAVAPAKLETRLFNAGPSLVEALFAGEIDVGYVGPGPAMAAHEKSRGRAFKVVAGASADGVVVVAAARSGVATLDDLRGKRLATPQLGNTQDIAARHFVKAHFGSVDAVRVIPVALAEQAAMFARGDLDAAWVPEPWGERLVVETGAHVVAEEKDLWPEKSFSLAVVVATNEMVTSHRDELAAVLSVHHRWTTRLRDQPAAHVPALGDALAALTGKKLPEGVLPRALGRVTFTDDPLPRTLLTMGGWSRELGFARHDADIAGLVDVRILEGVAR